LLVFFLHALLTMHGHRNINHVLNFRNPRVSCHSLPHIDLTAWKQTPQGCQIGGRSVPVGSSGFPTPCTSCICTVEGVSSFDQNHNTLNICVNYILGFQIIYFCILLYLLSLHFCLCDQPIVSSDLKKKDVIMYSPLGTIDEYGRMVELYLIMIQLLRFVLTFILPFLHFITSFIALQNYMFC